MQSKIQYIVFGFFISLLVLPNVFKNLIEIKPLEGYFELAQPPVFSVDNWFNGKFQEGFNRNAEDYLGFRNILIRIRNQLDYSLFDVAHASGVVIGKNKVLFQESYLNGYMGLDNVGISVIERKLDKLELAQEELKKINKSVILILAPGKASYYSEFIPQSWWKKSQPHNNYDLFVKEIKARKINFIDFREYFLKMKDTVRYPLFPKGGTHWSGYGVTLVMDTLVKYIEEVQKVDLINFKYSSGIVTDRDFQFTDNDIEKGLNLLFPTKTWEVYYPDVQFESDTTKSKPNVLSIGDSFNQSFWGFYPFYSLLFGEQSQFWYYNRIVSWPDSIANRYISTELLDYKKEIEKRDIILIVLTEPNLNDLGFSFIDRVYNIYNPEIDYEKRVSDYMYKVRNDSNLFLHYIEKARSRNITTEKMIFIDAVWLIDESERQKDQLYYKINNHIELNKIFETTAIRYNISAKQLKKRYIQYQYEKGKI